MVCKRELIFVSLYIAIISFDLKTRHRQIIEETLPLFKLKIIFRSNSRV